MSFWKDSIEQEKNTINKMINLFCRGNHGTKECLCQECSDLKDYALKRLQHCKFGVDKPTCEKCTVHCYKPDMREKVKKVMRYAGPRMIFIHPIAAVIHLIKSKKKN